MATQRTGRGACPTGAAWRAGDDYDQTHNARLATRDTTFGGQVSCLQVARLMATAARQADDAENMVRCVVLCRAHPLPALPQLCWRQEHGALYWTRSAGCIARQPLPWAPCCRHSAELVGMQVMGLLAAVVQSRVKPASSQQEPWQGHPAATAQQT